MTTLSLNYQRFQRLVSMLLQTFFYKIEVSGLENIPKGQGGLLIAWHPNGMIDPGLIISSFPHQVVFGARHGLFSWPILGQMMSSIGTVPIYRKQDVAQLSAEEQRQKNVESLENLAAKITDGAWAALFPEGVSHDDPFVQSLKTGAARIFYQARKNATEKNPVIIPVGLYYDKKHSFRSRALVQFYPAITLPKDLDCNPSDEEIKEKQKALTSLLEDALTSIIFALESWELHAVFHRAGKLVRAERIYRAGSESDRPEMEELILGLSRIWIGYHEMKEKHPAMVAELVSEVSEYHKDLEVLGIEDHELDGNPKLISFRIIAILLLQVILYLFVFPPILIVGYIMNLPTTILITFLSEHYSSLYKDKASVKLFSSIVLFPLTWIFWSWLAYIGYIESIPYLEKVFVSVPDLAIAASLFIFCLGMLSAIVMFTYIKASKRVMRSLKVRLTKNQNKSSIMRLKQERSRLCDMLTMLASRLDLPGEVGEDGRLKS